MTYVRISTKQHAALRLLHEQTCPIQPFPSQPYPHGVHNVTWTSLHRRGLTKTIVHDDHVIIFLSPAGLRAYFAAQRRDGDRRKTGS